MTRTLLALTVLSLAACADEGDDTSVDADLLIAQDLWTEISGYSSWDQATDWTGIVASEDGTHGAYVQIWLNETASSTIAAAAGGDMPDGAILVKEGYRDEAGTDVTGVTVMKKVAGYDADHGDWFWAKFDTAGDVKLGGQEPGCYGCHSDSPQDFVMFTTW